MLNVFSIVWPAATVFASTNLDDLVVVASFFSEPKARWRNVVGGQFIGMGALVFASALGAIGALTLSRGFIAYLGIAPVAAGLYRLWRVRQPDVRECGPAAHDRRERRLDPITVAIVTMANGADNLSVYVPFFAKAPSHIMVYVATFACLTGLWCLAGFLLVNHTVFSSAIRRISRVILPIVMIIIGLSLLTDAHS